MRTAASCAHSIRRTRVRLSSLGCRAHDPWNPCPSRCRARARFRRCSTGWSAAKVRIADACRRVSQESVQLHGGMGMSDELKISHTFRRLTALAQQFGDADHHLARLAALER
ncbi:MAG TPA: acyl-CoA dehydrogenase family protein [Casimicrobiaceae bacterium]|nr:acyl-CoA dehydrogenase family protein [Casimicrobiaceae bacterium]